MLDWDQESIRQASAVPTQREVAEIILGARSHLRDFLLLRMLYVTGLRRAEAVALLVGDIFWDCRSLFVRSGKGDKDRYVLLDQLTLELLKSYLGDAPVDRRIFPHTGKWVHDTFLIYAKPTGLIEKYASHGLRLSPHSLRFAFGTHFYDNGLDFAVTTALLGHTLPQDSLFYIDTARSQLERSYAACSPYALTEAPPPLTGLACYHYPSPASLREIEREFASQPEAARRDRLPSAPTRAEMETFLETSRENPDA